MSCVKFMIAVVVAMVVGGAATPATAMPQPHPQPHPRKVDVAAAVNRTVCPIEITIDEDPERVPRRIKVLQCAANPGQVCREQGIPRHDCCAHHHSLYVMECVEIVDTVIVHYPNSDAPHKMTRYEVSVGCTCMFEQSTRASLAT